MDNTTAYPPGDPRNTRVIKGFAQPRIAYPVPGRRPRTGEVPFIPINVGKAYGFPKLTIPANPIVPIICFVELGGGYVASDFTAAAAAGGYPAPSVANVSVGGAGNSPGSDADGEVALDGQVGAPTFTQMTGLPAKVVYVWAPNTGPGIGQAVAAATAYIKANGGLGVVSISWGQYEKGWASADIQSTSAAILAARGAGVRVCVASGDNGSSDGASGNNADYPASDPGSIGCGGTTLTVVGGVPVESVWNSGGGAGGGGVSAVFATPAYQKGFLPSGLSGRGVPDVSGDADPNTGYLTYIDGQLQPVGGTSAVAPLVAGYLAGIMCATQKPLIALPDGFYPAEPACNDVVSGNNGQYSATKGYDLASGLGSINGARMTPLLLLGAPTPTGPTGPTPTGPTSPTGPTAPPAPLGPTLAAVQAADKAAFATVAADLHGRGVKAELSRDLAALLAAHAALFDG